LLLIEENIDIHIHTFVICYLNTYIYNLKWKKIFDMGLGKWYRGDTKMLKAEQSDSDWDLIKL